MRINNIKIRTQLMIGFSVIMIFVITLGIVAYIQTHQLHQQTTTMYEHPLQTRNAIGALEADILEARVAIRDLILAYDEQEKQTALRQIEISNADSERQFSILYELYLGPISDIDNAHEAFVNWRTAANEPVKLALSGEAIKAVDSLHSGGAVMIYREKMLVGIQIIDVFAKQRADELYATSVELSNTMSTQLLFLVISILVLSLIISYFLLQNIRKPLKAMNSAVLRFHQGAMDARSHYKSENELGTLSASINILADHVQKNVLLNEKTSKLSTAMLSEQDDQKFFRAILGALADQTGSHLTSVYLLNADEKTFDHFESIGTDDTAKQSFKADCFEGEFGTVLLTRKPQYIKSIPEDTRFIFQTVNGKFVPREIITIPIITNNQVIAIISLACITEFNQFSMDLIDSIIVAMSSRIEGILAYRRIKEFRDVLEKQNRELDIQKNELSAQTTELMQQNTELEMQKKQLNEASRLKTNFLSNMSHELRTPLNSVIALSGLLSRKLANQIPIEQYGYLEIIERNGKNLLELINDVLDISRIEAGREEIEINKFNANNAIDEVIAMIQPQAQQQNIELLHESKDTIIISSDVDKFRHILQNLIGNAVKFTEKGKVIVSSHQSGNNIIVKVMDTGIGIAAEHLPYIFDEFRQADGSTSRRFGGTGLGLAISKKYANMLGGAISVKSTLNEGSEFTLSIPLLYSVENRIKEQTETEDHKVEMKQPLAHANHDSSEKTILLVEDNESAVIQIKDLVEDVGFQVKVAHDANEAFKILDQAIPDAMILDLMMPDIDGFKVLEIMRNAELTAHIPVLILTAKHITKEELATLKRNNIHQLIQKGDVKRLELQNAVTNMLYPQKVKNEKSPPRNQTGQGKPVVLVVEDNPDNMITVKALLSDHHTVLEAVNAHECLEMTKKHFPDLILMDIALPDISGIEVFKEIRGMSQFQSIPIIALTASAMTHDREAILSNGFDAFIAKPIIAKEFFEMIQEVLYGK